MSSYYVISSQSKHGPLTDVSKYQSRVQEIRLFAALLEAGWSIKVNKNQLAALVHVNKHFPIRIETYNGQLSHDINIYIDHSVPITAFGHVKRRLIFPEWLFSLHKKYRVRRIRCSFEGFPTSARVLAAWQLIKENFSFSAPMIDRYVYFLAGKRYIPFRITLLNRIFGKVAFSNGLFFRWSKDGRKGSNKILDEGYWDNLIDSEMVFCPPGDFIWTYRFYEAVVAKALPVLQHEDSDIRESGYFTVNQILADSAYEAIKSKIENNHDIAFSELTAKRDLDPINFGL